MDYIEKIIILPKIDNSLLGNICAMWGGNLKNSHFLLKKCKNVSCLKHISIKPFLKLCISHPHTFLASICYTLYHKC